MQTQTPEEAKRFLVRFFSIFGIVASLIAAGTIYIQYAIVSTYFPSNPQFVSSVALIFLLGLTIWFSIAALNGRWLPFNRN